MLFLRQVKDGEILFMTGIKSKKMTLAGGEREWNIQQIIYDVIRIDHFIGTVSIMPFLLKIMTQETVSGVRDREWI